MSFIHSEFQSMTWLSNTMWMYEVVDGEMKGVP